MKQELLKGGTDQLKLGLKDHGRDIAPASCSVRILEGTTVLEAGIAALGVFAPSAAVTGEIHQDLTAEWTFTRTAGVASERQVELFDVVLFRLVAVVTDEDLIHEVASLAAGDYVHHGEVSDPEADSIIDRTLVGCREDYAGGILTMLSGVDAGSQYIVASFSPTTGEIGVTAFGTTPEEGDSFTLRRSFQGELNAAWEDIIDKLNQQCSSDSYASLPTGGTNAYASRPYLIMSPDRLRRPHLLRTLEKIFRGMADDPAGVDWARAEYYAKEFESVWNGLRLVFASGSETDEPHAVKEGTSQWGFGR